jgi:multicomponent K+:H+ antiporter subunit F
MIDLALDITLGAFALAMAMNLVRLYIGPSVADRILALDTLNINALALLVVFGLKLGSDVFFEAALIIAMLGFVATIALAKFVMRRDIIE